MVPRAGESIAAYRATRERIASAPPARGAAVPQAGQPTPVPSEPSLKIGTIEVHIEAPPRVAARPSATAPLARGFLSTLGLRQG
jgi:hypothetical protein